MDKHIPVKSPLRAYTDLQTKGHSKNQKLIILGTNMPSKKLSRSPLVICVLPMQKAREDSSKLKTIQKVDP